MRTSALFEEKKDFSKFMVWPHGQGELSQCRHFADRVNFSRFCADVFYGRPLM